MSTSEWWRRLCWVTPQLACSGDLGDDIASMKRHLAHWVDIGITHIVDCRIEADDTGFVRRLAPHIEYTWLGVDDDNAQQPDAWFDAGADAVAAAAIDPRSRIVVHCHMGVNRGPSLLFAAMLRLGHQPVDAIAAIRRVRPIAAMAYADDAVCWWARRTGAPATERDALDQWRAAHPCDSSWITRRVRGEIRSLAG